jgi:hypothetical protein
MFHYLASGDVPKDADLLERDEQQALAQAFRASREYTTYTQLRGGTGEFTWVQLRPNRLIYASLWTMMNSGELSGSDCGSEDRGFEPRRSPLHLQGKVSQM